MRPVRSRALLLLGILGLSALSASLPSSSALAQSSSASSSGSTAKKEEKKQQILDFKAYERERNREAYGELANTKRQEAIAQLKDILAKNPNLPPDTKAEMLMRLAELYFEQSKYEYDQEMQRYEKEYQTWFDLPEAQQKSQTEPKVDDTKSKAYTKKAIENYRVILQNYPNFGRVDESLFFLAYMLNDIGEEKDALEMYNQLVKSYPKSAFIPDAYNAIGEYYFNNNNAYKALQAYKRAAAYKDSKIYTFALYKMAWCYYNVGEFSTAIETMQELVAETDRRIAEAGGAEAGISLKDEALRDLVLFFSEEGNLEAAKEYFTRYGEKKYYRQMLARLGKIYMEQGKNPLAIQTYRELIADNPLASDNPEHQNEIIQGYWKLDQFDEANEEINKLVEVYGKGSRWSGENVENKEAVREAEKLIEKNLRNVAIDSHQQALKRKSAKLLLLAEENYKRYLDYFGSAEKGYEMRYWYAEVLYKLKKYDLATDAYEQVVGADPKGKFLKDAAANTIFSIDEYIKPMKSKLDKDAADAIKKLKATGSGTAKYAEVELHEWEKRLVKACDTYAKVLPNESNTQNFLYKAALLLHDRNHFNESNDRFLQIVRANPSSDMAEHGVHEILESYHLIENWTDLNAVAREFYNNPTIGKDPKFKTELKGIYQRATFKIAEGHAAAEKWPDAAGAFDAFFREFGDSDVRDIALYNAAFYWGKAGDKRKMVTLRHEFVDSFPKPVGKDSAKAQLYEKSVALLAQHYAAIADYGKAAEFSRRLYDADKSFQLEGFGSARDALYNAALFKEAQGDWQGAVKDFGDYAAAWPDASDILATRMKIAKLLANSGQTEAAMNAYKIIGTDKKIQTSAFDTAMEAWVEYGRLLGKKGDRKGQLAWYAEGMKLFATAKTLADTAPARLYAAEMRFELLEPRFAEYAALKMSADMKKGLESLKKKETGLADLQKEYVAVLDLKQGEWGIAALYRIGTLYGEYADALTQAPCPPKLDEGQCDIYKFGLQDKAYPVIDKAVEAFGKARDKSYELGVYTQYTNKSLAELTRLRPDEYPPNAEEVPPATYTSNPYATADFVR
jgi:tetratricopeptide (TPR) repeat protein